jgi:hypothetical protein
VSDDSQEPQPLRAVLGDGVRRVRAATGVRQEDISRAAQRFGLTWSRGRIWDLERGLKAISAEELVMLPVILGEAAGQPVTIDELIDPSVLVALTDKVDATGEMVRTVFHSGPAKVVDGEIVKAEPRAAQPESVDSGGDASEAETERFAERFRAMGEASRYIGPHRRLTQLVPAASEEDLWTLLQGSLGEAERRAAVQLGESPYVVLGLARALWDGRSLAEERDRIVLERPDAGSDPERLRGLRGHVTRQLVGQMHDLIESRGGPPTIRPVQEDLSRAYPLTRSSHEDWLKARPVGTDRAIPEEPVPEDTE